jgi:hypothetical protein
MHRLWLTILISLLGAAAFMAILFAIYSYLLS